MSRRRDKRITMDEWLAATGQISSPPPEAFSARDLARARGWAARTAQQHIRDAIEAGELQIAGWREYIDDLGRKQRRAVYLPYAHPAEAPDRNGGGKLTKSSQGPRKCTG